MPFNILYVAYPLLTVSRESAGGAEQVLWTLEREMARRGLATAVAASAGSSISGELLSTGAASTRLDDYERRNREHQDRIVELTRSRAHAGRGFHLIHDMSGSFWTRATEFDVPVLATLHLPRSFYPLQSFQDVPPSVHFNCVSSSQAASFADLNALLGVAANGIAMDSFLSRNAAAEVERSGLLWLGRICEEKAPHMALDIAARAALPITLAGQLYPFSFHQQYFEREIAPRLGQMPDANFVAAPSFELKCNLLRRAQALLITSQVDETSSLVAMEAAACETPVIAFRRGALAEVVKDNVTGFVVDEFQDAVEACGRAKIISNAACVAYARENFSSTAMADSYSRLYAGITIHTSELAVAGD